MRDANVRMDYDLNSPYAGANQQNEGASQSLAFGGKWMANRKNIMHLTLFNHL